MEEKLAKLKALLVDEPSAAIAFSGGVDSAFLLTVAHEMLGDGAFAATAVSSLLPASERKAAAAFCEDGGIRQIVVEVDPLQDAAIAANTVERCYLCKRLIFEKILENVPDGTKLLDGTNADDVDDFRPGMRALEELGVASPLRDVGLTKREIRQLAREMGLKVWDKPSSPCLATRIPYGTPLTLEQISRVEAAEDFMHELGFEDVRVRAHGDIARLEVYALQLPRLVDPEIRRLVSKRLKEIGFTHITADLDPFSRTAAIGYPSQTPR